MPSYVLPQVLVFQEFRRAPVALDQPLRACIVGEQYDLHRYSDEDEKPFIKVSSTYDPSSEVCYEWPGRQAGAVVDAGYSKVFFDDALLKYFTDPAGAGSYIFHVTPGKNRIRANTLIFQTANGFSREVSLLRDVKAGDVIKIVTTVDGGPVTFKSSVVGLLADTIASSIDPSVADVSNQAATVAATSFSQTAGTDNDIDISSVDGTAYDGLEDGDVTEVYTVEVVNGGGQNVAVLRITSQSGNDDQGLVTYDVPFGTDFPVGTRGLTVNWAEGVDVPLVTNGVFLVGQKWEVEVTQLFTISTHTSSGDYTGTPDTTYIVEVTRGGTIGVVDPPQISVTTTTGVDISGPTDVTVVATPVDVGTQGVLIEFGGPDLCKGDRYLVTVEAATPGEVRTLILAHNLPVSIRRVTGLTGDTVNLSPTVLMSDTTGVLTGQAVFGTGITLGTTVTAITPNVDITLSAAATATNVGVDLEFAPDLGITLYIKKNIEVPDERSAGVDNWTQSETELCLQPGINGFDSEWALSGVPQSMDVEDAIVYIEHRDRVASNINTVGTIADVSEIPDKFSTAPIIHPDNPLVFGVFKALENANGEEVKYLGVHSSTGGVEIEDWLSALDKLVGRDDVYGLVPLTQSKDVLDAFLAHCDAESSPENGRWRICFLNRPAVDLVPICVETIDEDPILATILDDPETTGTQYTIVEVDGGEFITKGVRPGDKVRALYTTDGFGNIVYTEFTVDEVINEESLRLLSGPDAPVNVAAKIEIWRTLTRQELADELATYPGLFKNRRAALVWPDVVGNAGLTFAGYFLCAGLAGLRSGSLPHQGLTNVELLGFDDLSRTVEFFSATQLNVMAASGYWIVTQDPNDGTVFTRHQLTCGDQTDVNQREQSITTNLDHLSFNFLFRMKTYIGKGNVTPTMIDIVRGEVISVIEQFKNNIVVDRLGPQIIDAQILELRQHPTFKDRILARVLLTLPAPFNNLELHLIVQ